MLTKNKPLDGVTVLEFSQFLSGPVAGLRLADLGARVIKIERPDVGDLCRNLYISDTDLEGDSTLFHAINRNKESFAANLKDPKDLGLVKKLIEKADIITQNFRPGVIQRIGLDYESVKKINSKINVTMIHGQKDEVVPVSYSRKVLKVFQKAKKKLLIIEDGDHSLSSQKWLKIIIKELKMIV